MKAMVLPMSTAAVECSFSGSLKKKSTIKG